MEWQSISMAAPKSRCSRMNTRRKRAVIGLVEAVDPPQRFGDGNALIVDFLGVADDAGDRAEAAGNPHRAGIGE